MDEKAIKRVCELIAGLALVGAGFWCWTKGWNEAGTVLVIFGVMEACS